MPSYLNGVRKYFIPGEDDRKAYDLFVDGSLPVSTIADRLALFLREGYTLKSKTLLSSLLLIIISPSDCRSAGLHIFPYYSNFTKECKSSLSKITGSCVVVLAQPGSVLRLVSSQFIRIPFSHSFVELL